MPESPYRVAQEWPVVTLAAVCEAGGGSVQTGPFGSQLHASDYVDEGVPAIMPTNLGDGTINPEGIARITANDAARLGKYLVQPNDIVYSRRGDVTKRGFVTHREAGWLCGTGCLRVRLGLSNSLADPRYIHFYLSHPAVKMWVQRHAVGATMPNLNTGILGSLPVVLPPLDEQRSIGSLLGLLDDKVEMNRRVNETLESMAQAHFGELVRSHESDCVATTLGDVCSKPQYGFTASGQPRGSTGHSFLRIADINKSPFIDWTTVPDCEIDPDLLAKYELAHGDLVIARMADPGHAALVEEPPPGAIFASYLIRFRPQAKVVGRFLKYWTRSTSYWALVRGRQAGTTRANLNAKVLGGFTMDLPPLPALEAFDTWVEPLIQKQRAALDEIAALIQVRDTLLPKLLSGEVRVQQAEEIVEAAT